MFVSGVVGESEAAPPNFSKTRLSDDQAVYGSEQNFSYNIPIHVIRKCEEHIKVDLTSFA